MAFLSISSVAPLKTNNGGWRQRVPRGFLVPTLLRHKRLNCDLVWSHFGETLGRDISLNVIQVPRPKSVQFLTWHCDLFPSRNTDQHHELLGSQPSSFVKITSLTTIYCNYYANPVSTLCFMVLCLSCLILNIKL